MYNKCNYRQCWCLAPGNKQFYESISVLIGRNKSPMGVLPWGSEEAQEDLQGFKVLQAPSPKQEWPLSDDGTVSVYYPKNKRCSLTAGVTSFVVVLCAAFSGDHSFNHSFSPCCLSSAFKQERLAGEKKTKTPQSLGEGVLRKRLPSVHFNRN